MNEERTIFRRVVQDAPISVEELARRSGVSSDTLWAWAAGRRNPSPESAAAVAEVLEQHGAGMVELADELREAAE